MLCSLGPAKVLPLLQVFFSNMRIQYVAIYSSPAMRMPESFHKLFTSTRTAVYAPPRFFIYSSETSVVHRAHLFGPLLQADELPDVLGEDGGEEARSWVGEGLPRDEDSDLHTKRNSVGRDHFSLSSSAKGVFPKMDRRGLALLRNVVNSNDNSFTFMFWEPCFPRACEDISLEEVRVLRVGHLGPFGQRA